MRYVRFDTFLRNATLSSMRHDSTQDTGAWNFRDVPRDLMRKVKMAAAHGGKTVKEFLIQLVEVRLEEMERQRILPKGTHRPSPA